MSNEIQKPPPIETNPGTAKSADWITDEAGEAVLSPGERPLGRILRKDKERDKFRKKNPYDDEMSLRKNPYDDEMSFQKKNPYDDEMSLRKKPEDLIEPQDKLGDNLEGLDTHYPEDRLKGINPNQAELMKKILEMLIPKENPVAPSTNQQHPKTDFQSPTIPYASFEGRKIK